MPKPFGDQADLQPRERDFANGIVPGEPMELTVGILAAMKEQAKEVAEAKKNYRRSRSHYDEMSPEWDESHYSIL